MPYAQQTWTDNVTPVDAAHMTHIEAGIAAVEAEALPQPVVNGQWIKGVGGAAVWAPQSAYGTTLPASPLDGDEAILVDSTTNPSYQWSFRYNAGSSSAYKWEFVGGAPLIVQQTASHDNINTGGSPIDLASFVAPVVPRAGNYTIRFGCWTQVFSTVVGNFYLAVNAIGWNAMATPTAQYSSVSIATEFAAGGLAASTVLKLRVQTAASGTNVTANMGFLSLTPLRVS